MTLKSLLVCMKYSWHEVAEKEAEEKSSNARAVPLLGESHEDVGLSDDDGVNLRIDRRAEAVTSLLDY